MTGLDLEPALGGVPETALWTLHHRAIEASRTNRVLNDPKALELVRAIKYPFYERFGADMLGASQAQALRVKCFDLQVQTFLGQHPNGNVVALGEGLETQFWRVDNGHVRWLTVDLPVIANLRRRLLPESPRQRVVATFVTDWSWMDAVDPSQPTLITAQGLLMYLSTGEVHQIIAACAQRFPAGRMIFDTIPSWFRAVLQLGMRVQRRYTPPPLPWVMNRTERQTLRQLHPNIVALDDLYLPPGRGLFFSTVSPRIHRIELLRRNVPVLMMRLQFGTPARAC